jgi:hypothetical protein
MNFLKIKILSGCCTGQANGKGRILEWCNIEVEKLWNKLYKELKFEDYVSSYSPELLEKIHDALLKRGSVRNEGCDNCGTIYLFQPSDKEFESNFEINSHDVIKIKDLIYLVMEDRPCSASEIEEKYKLPDWFDYAFMPEYAHKNDKRIRYSTQESRKHNISEDEKYIYSEEKCDRYMTLKKYLENKLEDNITREQITELLSIKISDYDWIMKEDYDDDLGVNIPRNSKSNKLLFQKIKKKT